MLPRRFMLRARTRASEISWSFRSRRTTSMRHHPSSKQNINARLLKLPPPRRQQTQQPEPHSTRYLLILSSLKKNINPFNIFKSKRHVFCLKLRTKWLIESDYLIWFRSIYLFFWMEAISLNFISKIIRGVIYGIFSIVIGCRTNSQRVHNFIKKISVFEYGLCGNGYSHEGVSFFGVEMF